MAGTRENFVVAIGASAGGLEAIHQFFDHMSDTVFMSFVIIQHLSSDYESMLVELVSRHTHMQVFEARNGLEIKPQSIYVIPNNKFITVSDNRFRLEERSKGLSPNAAIDTFLYSLAMDKTNRAIAVILSGTGTDGTKGIEAIKNRKGMVLVQDPVTAKFDGMPNSAVALGIADHVLPPSDMPQQIMSYVLDQEVGPPPEFDERQLENIFALIHQSVGFDFQYYKLPTIIRRIGRRMGQLNISAPDDYVALLEKSTDECGVLANDFLIGVTRFFRDPEAWDALREAIDSEILRDKTGGAQIKVWVCGCSTGEEAYTIGIVLDDLISKSARQIDVKIFATDIDESSIEIAARGFYALAISRDVPPQLLENYFVQRGNQYQVSPRIRKQIVFAKHDIIRDPPFINNDLVICRNLLIYLQPYLQQKVYSSLMFALPKNGLLFLGPGDHSPILKENAEELNAPWNLHRKTRYTKVATAYLSGIADEHADRRRPARNGMPLVPSARQTSPLLQSMTEVITDHLHIAGFYIQPDGEIKESAGNYERILPHLSDSHSRNLITALPHELRFILGARIRRASRDGALVRLTDLKSKKGDIQVSWDVIIKPVGRLLLLVISERTAPVHALDTSDGKIAIDRDEYISTLRGELDEVRTNLDMAVQDLATANEELQSSNEELLSSNEELQSTNEELQSLNEELHTLNTEHQVKIRELKELNEDLDNFFRSTDIAQIFLDRNLVIRRFNAASSDLVNLINSDIGRPLSHISNNIRYDNFFSDVEKALRSETSEREISLDDGRNMLMRIMPYLNRERNTAGVIITFVDITTTKQLTNTIRAVFNSSPGYILGFKAVRRNGHIDDFEMQTANTATTDLLRRPLNELVGTLLRRQIPFLNQHDLFEQFVNVVETDKPMHKEFFFEGENKWFDLIASRMMDGFVVTLSDITGKKHAEQRLRKNYLELVSVKNNLKTVNEQLENKVIERTMALSASEERFRLVARATNDALWEWNLVNNTMWLGETFFKLFGYENIGEQTNRNFWLGRIHEDDAGAVRKSLNEAVNSGQTKWSIEYRFMKETGGYAHILDRGYILHDEFGTPYRMLGSMFDVTELKTAQHKLATMNEQLEQKVAERTMELEKINTALEQSNNDLQQFASVASHDLQEPLRKIQMFARLIQESYQDEGDNILRQYVEKILHSSGRMRALITDILDYSKLSETDTDYEFTDLNELIRGTLDDFEMMIREKGATIEIDTLPTIEVIAGQIRQVFQNLLSNALKFSKPGVPPQVHITARTIAKRSFMSMDQEDGPYWLITVTDNGIGFDPQFAGNIFNLFHRLHSKDKFEGTGIGLAVTKRIIDKHKGLIRADSRETEGASFAMILPARHYE